LYIDTYIKSMLSPLFFKSPTCLHRRKDFYTERASVILKKRIAHESTI
jgi:hypothetical protein